MWFDGWVDIGRVLVSGVVVFAGLLLSVRLAGNRTLSSMNASDFIITVALGTTFASTMLSPSVTVTAGLTAVAVLIAIQAATVQLSIHWPHLRRRFEGATIPLVEKGELLHDRLARAHVSEAELRQAVRQEGYGSFDGIHTVGLEPNGRFTVIPRSHVGDGSALEDPRRPD